MLLAIVVSGLDHIHDTLCIGMVKPWGTGAPCCLVKLTDDHRWPKEVQRHGFEYFLEIGKTKEVLENCGPPTFSFEEQVEILLYYAENDAWPEWANLKLANI